MLKDGFNGFCMAMADSVPGVSGGTIAFIMGFYDNFIGSLNKLIFGKREEKKKAILYLIKLEIGWIIGMGLAVIVLSTLFEKNIYAVSSLFVGFIAGAIPFIIRQEKESFIDVKRGMLFGVLGAAIVVGITLLNGSATVSSINLGVFSLGGSIRLLIIGMIAISAMFLPGISGATILLIFGAYLPVITAIKNVMTMKLIYFPSLVVLGIGVLLGTITVVKGIKIMFEKFRTQTVYLILGMMVGSFYAIVMGPTTLEVAKAPLSIGNFNFLFCVVGLALIIGMEVIKKKENK